MNRDDLENLSDHVLDTYGKHIEEAAEMFEHKPELLAGIMIRESRGGLALKNGLGDGGHGHGLMQIDDRSFPEFCAVGKWADPRENIQFAAHVLAEKRRSIRQLAAAADIAVGDVERASIAAYNCGAGRVIRALADGRDVDFYTTGKDYSQAVLEYAAVYKEVADGHESKG